ncbi:hypothetical protein K7432_014127 [Basidiobolus ranarum]|uniref:NodB homology domain-containing protein n=1 Tax=Basidiobolus ranarum TaxID=34480 RepID=A0ABR2VPW7_9FUNG
MLLSSLVLYAVIFTASDAATLPIDHKKLPIHKLAEDKGVVSKCTKAGSFALTFDDGPDGKNTETLLDSLKGKGVKLTFFVVGQMLENAENVRILQRAYNEGHHIASHTYTHANLKKLSGEKVREEMKKTEDAIQKAIGVKPKYMRPPFGSYSSEALKVLKDMGYTVIIWNLDTLDWKTKNGPKTVNVFTKALKNADSKKDSYISLEHDIVKSSTQSVNEVINAIVSKGFKVTTIPKCLGRSDLYK